MGTYAYSGNQNKQRDNHADEYLPDLLNDIQDEIEIVEQVLSGGEEGQVLTADSAGKAKWAEASGGGGGGLASFSYTPGENENSENLFVLYPAAAEALHLNLNEQLQTVSVYIMLQLAESPYHMFEIYRAFYDDAWHLQIKAAYGSYGEFILTSGTYNILSVRMELGMI